MSSWKRLGQYAFEHSDGYRVQTDVETSEYIEGERHAVIGSDFRTPNRVRIFPHQMAGWFAGEEKTAAPMTAADRKRVIERVAEGYRFGGWTVEIVEM